MKSKKIPFIYRSFLNFWLAIVLPSCTVALVISKLYYNGKINFELLSETYTWIYFLFLQVFLGFFSYLWVYRTKVKEFKK